MTNNPSETALSEVIAFVLVLGLITAAFSLYLTYGVPAQGRENEILHMDVVKDQFVVYKIGLDSLFTNNLVGTTVSNSFSLGTGGGYTQGSNSIIPILSPVSSGGLLLINRRMNSSVPETLTITSTSYITGTGSTSVDLLYPAKVNYTPDHVYVTISIPSSVPVDATGRYGLTVSTSKWTTTVNLTPQVTYSTNFTTQRVLKNNQPTCSDFSSQLGPILGPYRGGDYIYYCLIPALTSNYTGTDLTINIIKENTGVMQNYPVYKNVQSGVNYTVDLMDSSYGLNPVTNPGDTISLVVDRPLESSIRGNGTITYDFTEKTNYPITPIPLGAIEYRSDNYYWIPQEYYYQMGGVFLSQSDGNTTYKLPPEISFSYNPSSKISTVNISALAITTDLRGGSVVGGNSPVQIKTTLTSIYPLPYAVGTANTKWIRIGVNTNDDSARVMWKNYFNYTARAAGLPNTFTGNTTTESYIFINGSDLSPTGSFDISVHASNVTYLATVYGVG